MLVCLLVGLSVYIKAYSRFSPTLVSPSNKAYFAKKPWEKDDNKDKHFPALFFLESKYAIIGCITKIEHKHAPIVHVNSRLLRKLWQTDRLTDQQTDRPIDWPTNRQANQQTDMRVHGRWYRVFIVFYLIFFRFFETLPVLLQRWCSTCLVCVHTLPQRENRERPESGIF